MEENEIFELHFTKVETIPPKLSSFSTKIDEYENLVSSSLEKVSLCK